MDFEDIIKLYKNLIIWSPGKWIWNTIHSANILDNYVGHVLSITFILISYGFIIYFVWCLIAGIFDILTYNKRRTMELNAKEKQTNNNKIIEASWDRLQADIDAGIAVPDPLAVEMFGSCYTAPQKNNNAYDMLLEATAAQHNIPLGTLKKALKK